MNNLNRRNFIVDFLFWILAFFFGYTTKNVEENLNLLKSDKRMVLDKEGNNISEDDISNQLVDNAINVKKFGAKGDGVTDDTIAIQNAINFAQTLVRGRFLDGANVLLAKGTFLISNTLTITDSNISLCGDSISTSVLYAPNANFDLVHFNGTALSLYGSGMKNLRVYTPGNATKGNHLRITKTLNSIFENLSLVGSYNGIAVDGCGKTYLDKIIISQEGRATGTTNYGIDFLDTNGINSDIHVSNVQVVPNISKSSNYSMSIRSSDGIYFSNFHIHGGVLIQPNNVGYSQTCSSLFFTNCYFDTANEANFMFTGSASDYRNFIFNNCYFREAVNGLVLNTTSAISKIQLTNCNFSQQDYSGVDCKNSLVTEVIFSACIFSDNNTVNDASYGDMLLQGVNIIINACIFKNGGELGYGVNFKSGLSKSTIAACNFSESAVAKKFVNEGSQNKKGILNGVE